MNQPPRATPTEPILTTAERRPGRAAAILGILLTILLAGSILAFLFYRSITAPQPNRVIVVRGSSEWHGVDLSVDGGNLKVPQVTGIEKLGNYVVPFFVWPGIYTLHVKNAGVEIYSKQFDMTTEVIEELDLNRTGVPSPTTRAATNPSDVPPGHEER
jgi:hypothetical protein